MIHASLFIAASEGRDRGVFTSEKIPVGTLIERSPVIVMTKVERTLLDQTLLHDYIFEWGHQKESCCMALGYIAVYNHSPLSNCEYEMDYEERIISVRTTRDIEKDEELFINYNGDWNDPNPVWFEIRNKDGE